MSEPARPGPEAEQRRFWAPGRARRRAARSAVALAVAERLAAELRAGQPALQALDTASAAGGGLIDRTVVAAGIGGDVSATLRAEATDGARALGDLAAVWDLGTTRGVGMAAAVDRIGASMADAERVRRELAGQLAAPKATGLTLAALPAVGVLLGEALGAASVQFLLGTPAGWVLLATACALDAVGVLWTFQIARRISAQL